MLSFLDPKGAKLQDDRREYFIRMVSIWVLYDGKDYNSSNNYTDELVKTMIQLVDIEPEFILQTAYYVKHSLKIRTCTNFILAFAFLNEQSQPFITQYFKTVLNPGDLIQVCQFVQVINHINKGIAMEGIQDLRKELYFPQFLKDYVMSRYKEFQLYQDGKQCSNINRKKTIREQQEFLRSLFAINRQAKRKAKLEAIYKAVNDTQNQDAIKQARQHIKQRTGRGRKHTKVHKKPAKQGPRNGFDMEEIIRFCRPILVLEESDQVEELCDKSKRYPATPEEFHQQIKDEKIDFNPEQAGKRMQVPVAMTNVSVLSFKNASKKQIWTDLLTKNQVPQKAILRNLRNILKADLDVPTLKKVIETIQNPQKVQKAKIFPFQYLNALSEVNKHLPGFQIEIDQQDPREMLFEMCFAEFINKRNQRNQVQVEHKAPKKKTPKFKINAEIGQELKIAIQNALQIAVEKNFDEISGQTYVFCDVSTSMSAEICGGKRYGSLTTWRDCGFVLGNMIKEKCQKCEFYLFGSRNNQGVCSFKCEVDTNILEGFKRCQEIAEFIWRGTYMLNNWEGPKLGQVLQDVLLQPEAFADTIIILTNRMIDKGNWGGRLSLDEIISGYLSNVNPNAKFFFMNLQGNRVQAQFAYGLNGKNCFAISGISNNVLKYISLAGSVGQVQDVRQFTKNAFQNQQMQQEKPAANP